MFSSHTNSGDSYWIIPQDQLYSYLEQHDCLLPFHEKITSLYKNAFPNYSSSIFSHFMPWTFAMYIRGRYKKTNNRPRVYELPRLISSIVSILTIEQEQDMEQVSIWNACNDLSVKGGYMRLLFDAVHQYAIMNDKSVIILYVALDNPYFQKAVQLYIEKGFYWVGMYREMAIHMEFRKYDQIPSSDTVESIVSRVRQLGYNLLEKDRAPKL